MSRYIDADDAIEKYAHYGISHMWDATDLEEILNEMQSIEIVRCKECRYYEAKEDWCYWRDEAITADDFCSYGVKKGADDES